MFNKKLEEKVNQFEYRIRHLELENSLLLKELGKQMVYHESSYALEKVKKGKKQHNGSTWGVMSSIGY